MYLELLGDHPFTATLMEGMGASYQALGHYESAIKSIREALRMRKHSLGDHQETARSFHDLGKVIVFICVFFPPLSKHLFWHSLGLGLLLIFLFSPRLSPFLQFFCFLIKQPFKVPFFMKVHAVLKHFPVA